jgi:predicted histidine transporter YuiF (NhaC family)
MDMQDIRVKAEDIIEHLTSYAENRWNLIVLNAAEKTSDLVSSLAAALVVGLLGGMALFFASIGMAWWIGQSTGNYASGFFYVALFYAVLGGVLFLIRNSLIKLPVINAVIKKFYYENESGKSGRPESRARASE